MGGQELPKQCILLFIYMHVSHEKVIGEAKKDQKSEGVQREVTSV